MTGANKNILRSILVLSYIAIIAFITFGISSLLSYLNTGADRSSMLHVEVAKNDQYLPILEWAPIQNEGRTIDIQTLKNIENDYLSAWHVKNIAYKTNLIHGISDYYTKNARKNIYKSIEQNKSNKITIEQTSLKHHIELNFFSEDGQLITLTDKNVIEYKRLYKNETVILETKEESTYKIIMLLEDGFWRIRHLKKEKSSNYKKAYKPSINKVTNIKGINYYPKASPWDMYGDKFDTKIISNDFKIIKDSGLNSIRIFVPYRDFGKTNIKLEKLNKLKQVLDLAEVNNLKVIVTLFDFYGDYSVLNWTLNNHHASIVVNALKNHNALLAWDIKNEPDLDFNSRGKINVIAWLENMIDLVKSVDKIHPVTIGWSNTECALILKNKLDLITFHYYEDLDDLDKEFLDLKISIKNKPIAITEFGISSYRGIWNPFGSSEKDQAEYHKQAQTIFRNNSINFMSWTLYDFTKIPKEVVGRLPWRKRAQEHFGFINQKGETKPAFKYISNSN